MNIKKYINSLFVDNEDNENVRKELLKSHKYKSSIDLIKLEEKIDTEKVLSIKELNILNKYKEGFGLEEIAKNNKSNKESIRLALNNIIQKINPEKKLKILNDDRT